MLNNFLQVENIMVETARRSATPEAQEHLKEIADWTIEKQKARLPSNIFLWGAIGAIGFFTLFFQLQVDAEKSLSVGQWVSAFFTAWSL